MPSSRNILFAKRIESLLHTTVKKFEVQNLEIRLNKRQVSFLVVKTIKFKRGIKQCILDISQLKFSLKIRNLFIFSS